jgi:hypothetical protein
MMRRPPRKYAGEQPLDPEQRERRGHVVRTAIASHATPGEAIAFLNTHSVELGGRPLDVATASADGLAAVEQALRTTAGASESR